MPNSANAYVRNEWKEGIDVTRMIDADTSDFNATIDLQNEEMIHLANPEVSLVISAAEGLAVKNCPLQVRSDVDLKILYSRTDSNWTINIIPNDLPEDIPTTMNVTLGKEEPEE